MNALPPAPPARLLPAAPAPGQTVPAQIGSVLSLGGKLYQIQAAATAQGPPVLAPFTPVSLSLGDQITIGTATYTVTPQLSLSLSPLPQIGAVTDAAGQTLAAFPVAVPPNPLAPPVQIHGTGFGTVAGQVDRNGDPQKVTAWSDTEIDLALVGQGSPRGWLTVLRADGAWATQWVWP